MYNTLTISADRRWLFRLFRNKTICNSFCLNIGTIYSYYYLFYSFHHFFGIADATDDIHVSLILTLVYLEVMLYDRPCRITLKSAWCWFELRSCLGTKKLWWFLMDTVYIYYYSIFIAFKSVNCLSSFVEFDFGPVTS